MQVPSNCDSASLSEQTGCATQYNVDGGYLSLTFVLGTPMTFAILNIEPYDLTI